MAHLGWAVAKSSTAIRLSVGVNDSLRSSGHGSQTQISALVKPGQRATMLKRNVIARCLCLDRTQPAVFSFSAYGSAPRPKQRAVDRKLAFVALRSVVRSIPRCTDVQHALLLPCFSVPRCSTDRISRRAKSGPAQIESPALETSHHSRTGLLGGRGRAARLEIGGAHAVV